MLTEAIKLTHLAEILTSMNVFLSMNIAALLKFLAVDARQLRV